MSYIGRQLNNIPGKVTAIASGALANGSKVIVNANGTVSALPSNGTATVTQRIVDATTYSSGTNINNSVTFDSNSNKVVVAWANVGNSSYGTARVGTVNTADNTISYGTAVVFASVGLDATAGTACTFDSNSNKVVIIYGNGSSNGQAIVGTVSGTNISFGATATFESGHVYYLSCTFDSNSNKVVIAYQDHGDSDKGKAVVGTVDSSNNTISFGTIVVYKNAASGSSTVSFDSSVNKVVIIYRVGTSSVKSVVGTVSGTNISFGSEAACHGTPAYSINSAFDSNSNKTVVCFGPQASPDDGTTVGRSRVGTISGTDISFGSAVVFETGNIGEGSLDKIATSFDSTVNKIIVAYRDNGNSNKCTIAVGAVSGTGISFATPVVFEDGPGSYFASVFDFTSERLIVAKSAADGNIGAASAITVGGTKAVTNLTAENYIGISDDVYANGADATIQVKGSVDDAQSSLTPGQSYFVQTDGTVGTTADSPSVFAGTAVASTKLIVKG